MASRPTTYSVVVVLLTRTDCGRLLSVYACFPQAWLSPVRDSYCIRLQHKDIVHKCSFLHVGSVAFRLCHFPCFNAVPAVVRFPEQFCSTPPVRACAQFCVAAMLLRTGGAVFIPPIECRDDRVPCLLMRMRPLMTAVKTIPRQPTPILPSRLLTNE